MNESLVHFSMWMMLTSCYEEARMFPLLSFLCCVWQPQGYDVSGTLASFIHFSTIRNLVSWGVIVNAVISEMVKQTVHLRVKRSSSEFVVTER